MRNEFRNLPIVFLFRGTHDLDKQSIIFDKFYEDRALVLGSFLDSGYGDRKMLRGAVEHAIAKNATLVILEHRDIADNHDIVSLLVESKVRYHFRNVSNERLKREINDAYTKGPIREARSQLTRDADALALKVAPTIQGLMLGCMTSRRDVAAELDRRGVPTAKEASGTPRP